MRVLKTLLTSEKGVVTLVAAVVLLSVMTLGIGMLSNSYLNGVVANNYKKKLQSYYAADGMMTLLAQQVMDGKGNQYINTDSLYLSDMNWSTETHGSLSLNKDKSCQGNQIRIAGTKFTKGLGTHATSSIGYVVKGLGYTRFKSVIGVDQEVSSSCGTVKFLVGKSLSSIVDSSSLMKPGLSNSFNIDISDWDSLYLVASDAGDGNNCDHADWANAQLVKVIPDTVTMGNCRVSYQVDQTSSLEYEIKCEAFKEIGTDKSFFTPLAQTVNQGKVGEWVTPPSINIPVTYYDYKNDGSNPEFGCHLWGQTGCDDSIINTVDSKLGSDGVPHRNYKGCHRFGFGRWFKPYDPGAGVFNHLKPVYGSGGILKRVDTVGYSPFENIEVHDSLTLTLIDTNGYYRYQNAFFHPLAGKGFGTDVMSCPWYNDDAVCTLQTTRIGNIVTETSINLNPHGPTNFCFTTVIHGEFRYKPGLKFYFFGDDDVYVFVDSTLIYSISHIGDTVEVDTLLTMGRTLIPDSTYSFDLFHSEIMPCGSAIEMTTNIRFWSPPVAKKRLWRRDYGNID